LRDKGLNRSGEKIYIRVKYCGGCNPCYDRVEAVERIRNALEGEAVLSVLDTEKPDIVLAIHGCETACTDLSPFRDSEIITISSADDIERAIRRLKKGLH
jgi:hypothetical protein